MLRKAVHRPAAAPAPPDTAALTQALAAGCLQLDLPVTEAQLQSLLEYLALLSRWTQVYNLTAVRVPAEMLSHHLLDSLSVVAPIRRQLTARTNPRLLDVGSGGGLPGVVLALLCPDLQVTCVDAVGKKATFVRQAAAELGLRNLAAAHARVETLPHAPGYDLITARAFSSLPMLCSLTAPLLHPDGTWAAMKGQVPAAEIAALPPAVEMFHVEHLTVPGLDAERCLVWMRPATQPN